MFHEVGRWTTTLQIMVCWAVGLHIITCEGKNNNNIIHCQVESSSQGAIAAPFPSRIEKSRGTCLSARRLDYPRYSLLINALIGNRRNKKYELHLHADFLSERTFISHGIIYVRRKSLPIILILNFGKAVSWCPARKLLFFFKLKKTWVSYLTVDILSFFYKQRHWFWCFVW